MPRKPKVHKCIPQINDQLRPMNTRMVTNLLNQNDIIIATEKITSQRKGRAMRLLATFCPFCGQSLTPSSSKPASASRSATGPFTSTKNAKPRGKNSPGSGGSVTAADARALLHQLGAEDLLYDHHGVHARPAAYPRLAELIQQTLDRKKVDPC